MSKGKPELIRTKEQLQAVLEREAAVYGKKWYYDLPFNMTEEQVLYKLSKLLRKAEYAQNTHAWNRKWRLLRLLRLETRYGMSIPLNVLGPGFSISHLGTVIINSGSVIGENCRIHPGVCVGANGGDPPRIGAGCYLGPGAKIFGDIELADGVRVGANAVVNKSCDIPGALLAGVPARVMEKQ